MRWFPSCKSLLCGMYKYSGLDRLPECLLRGLGRAHMSILLFHRVTDEIPEDPLTVSTDRFRAICRLLQNKYRVVGLEEIYNTVRHDLPIHHRTVAITFDDCYRDNLDAAHILAEHGLPATFFLPTAYVDTAHVFSWDRHLPQMPNLSWKDVREMVQMGFEMGSHTVTHANMGAIDRKQARVELSESKAELEDRLGQTVRWLAYPYGGRHNWNKAWLPLLAELGYEGCLSGYGGFIRAGNSHVMLPREPINYQIDPIYLDLHLRGCLNWYRALKRTFSSSDSSYEERQSLNKGFSMNSSSSLTT